MSEHLPVDTSLECRDASGSPGRLVGTILPVGRVAGDRPELFVGSGVLTPRDGIALLPEHRSKTVIMRFDPIVASDGSLQVDHLLPDTPEGVALASSVRSGSRPGLSIEFHSLDEALVSGVREVRQSLVTAVATVPSQSYDQAKAEVRSKRRPGLVVIELGLRQANPRAEIRESYTAQVVSRLISAASGATGDGSALGAIETAARWWGAGLASATVTPATSALASISPSVLDTIGRSLCRFGESLHVIDVRNGQVSLTPCGAWSVLGNDNPSTWRYRTTLSGPTSSRTVTIPAASVLHFMYSPDPTRPWIGRSPMSMALATARVASLLETATAGELNFVQQ